MSALANTASTPVRVRAARFTARHPEWWVVSVAAGAWVTLLAGALAGVADDAATVHAHHGHGVAAAAAPAVPLQGGAAWLLMVVAMMALVVVPRIRHVTRCCLGRVRSAAVAETVAGVLVVWSAVGVLVVGATAVAPTMDVRDAPLLFAASWLLAAAWQLTPWKATALARCHAVRVPRGTAAGRQRLTAGMSYAGWCVVSCGPAMAVMALTGHPLVLMSVLTVGFAAERVAHRPHRAVRRVAVAVSVAAAASFVVGLAAG